MHSLITILQIGDYVDAQDMELKWYDSRIVEIEPAFSSASPLPQVFKGTAGDKLHVHFMGWDNKYDMWFTRTSEKVQPLFTKVRNWRDFRVNDKIEMRVAGKWYACNVENVDRTSYKITVRPLDKTLRASLGDKQFEFFRCVRNLHRRLR